MTHPPKNRQQGHPETRQTLQYSEVSREGQRCGSGEVDRGFIRLMTRNLGGVEKWPRPRLKVSICSGYGGFLAL